MQILKSSLSPYHGDLVGFSRERVNIIKVVELRTTFGIESNIKTIGIQYLIVDSWALHHIILGRPSLNTLGAVVSTSHLAKFPISPTEVGSCMSTKKKLNNPTTSHWRKRERNKQKEEHRKSTWLKLIDLERWIWGIWILEKKEGQD